jgi:hypothetical protein
MWEDIATRRSSERECAQLDKEPVMPLSSLFRSPNFLRAVLMIDAAVSGGTGLLLALGGGLLEPWIGVPATLTRGAGVSLLPFAALVAYVATRPTLSQPAIWAVVVYNALWAIDSFALMLSGWIAPTLLGYAFIAAQALAVALLAELQYVGLRNARTTAA